MKFRDNLIAQLIYRSVLLALGIVGSVFCFVFLGTASDGGKILGCLYYTDWSCWFATLVAFTSFLSTLIQVIQGKRVGNNTFCPSLKFSANIMIIATFFVAAFALENKIWMAGYWSITGTVSHFFLPILTVLDSILFDRKRRYRVSYPFFALIAPLIYWIVIIARFSIARGNYGGAIPEAKYDYYYPYGWTNVDELSYGLLIGILAAIMVVLIAIGFLYWWLDKRVKGEDGKAKFVKGVDEEKMTDLIHYLKVKKQ